MKIYDTEGFPNPARVRVALAEKGALEKVEFIPVDVMGGEHRTEAFKSMNPDAVVPCLELEDGSHISQCTAITEYIDGTFAGASLCGKNARDRAQKQRDVATQTMGYLDGVLEQNEFLAGDAFSMADITAFAGLAFADFAKIEIPENLSHLHAWRAKVAARPSIAA